MFKEVIINELFIIIFLNILVFNSVACFFVKNPVYTLFFLILNYMICGFFLILNNLVFLGILFMLIYIGAISILLLFTLMLLNLKIIYYKSFKKTNLLKIFYFLLFVEIFFFIQNNKNNLYLGLNYYENWFFIINIKNDLINIAYELYIKNSSMLVVCSLLLLMCLMASVNIVDPIKSTKSQESYVQIKKYNKYYTRS